MRPLSPERLEEQLESEARFFNEDRNVRVDHARRAVRISKILKSSPTFFLRVSPPLLAYVDRYRAERVPEDCKIEYVPYNRFNNRPPAREG